MAETTVNEVHKQEIKYSQLSNDEKVSRRALTLAEG